VKETIPQSTFAKQIIAKNTSVFPEFRAWKFLPGMLFQSMEKWWGNGGTRLRPHEGLDLCLYLEHSGNARHLPTETQIPALYDGTIVSIIRDFMGLSIFVGSQFKEGQALVWAFGHMAPHERLSEGLKISMGELLGTLAANTKKGGPPSHLHISMGWLKTGNPPTRADWDLMVDSSVISLLDPLQVLGLKSPLVERP